MDAVTGQDRQTLLAELAQAREKLDLLVEDLRGIDRELDGLATDRKQHRLLHDVCGALEELGEIGGAGLFWGGAVAGTAEDHIRRVRSRVDAFEKRIGEIEDRRQAALEAIDRQQNETDLLDADVLEAEEAEERFNQEWIIEREMDALPTSALILPWTRGGEDDERFRKSLRTALLASLLFALVVPHIPLPLRMPEETIEVPDRVVRMMMQPRPLPPAAREAVIPEPKRPEQAVAETPAQQLKPKQGMDKGPGQGPGTGPGKGILAFRENLSGITENQAVARLGSQARISAPGAAPSGVVERSMITTQAPGSSGGINLAELSRGLTGGGAGGAGSIEVVQIARATSTIAGGGGGHAAGQSVGGGGARLGRTDEEIQIVFDRHKAALYRLYNRELRSDPTLRGQMVLRIRIEPDGSVTLCELQGTDMRAPQLVAQVLERVRTFDFGAKEVPAITILYPIDFLPAT